MKNTLPNYHYAAVATDMAVFTIQKGRLSILLIQMKKDPFGGMWAMPGGLVRPSESIEEAAGRILYEKTNLKKLYLEQMATFGKVDRDPFGRVVSVAYMALIPSEDIEIRTTAEYGDIAWFPIENVPALAYDHADMLKVAVTQLASRLMYSNLAFKLMPPVFTLTELQGVYESILGEELDKRNFRKRLLSLGLIEAVGQKRKGQTNRPAALYQFIHKKE